MDRGYRAIRFDELEDVPWKEGLTLRPVRSQLGLKAFGAAGFVGRNAGDLVVEPHTEEEGRGHQELYVILRGAACFTLDGETLDVPAGTLIVVELPDSPGAQYAMALAAAAAGQRDEARRWLDSAIARVPELRHEARNDSLLE